VRYLFVTGFVFLIVFGSAFTGPRPTREVTTSLLLNYIKRSTQDFSESVEILSSATDQIDSSEPGSIVPVREALKNCRLRYKKISFFLDYFYPQAGKLYNGPPKKELEEPFMEYEDPQGMQQIESILFGPDPEKNKSQLTAVVLVIRESSEDLTSLYFGFDAGENKIMESIRLELIRIMTLYITGYDAPDLQSGLQESISALESMKTVVNMYSHEAKWNGNRLSEGIKEAIAHLKLKTDFDQFDRMHFLTRYALPLEEKLAIFIRANGWEINSVPALEYHSRNLFNGEIIPSIPKPERALFLLGEKLFFDTQLSGNGKRSCASCHQPGKYFTDQLERNRSANLDSFLPRNTPTLLYAAYQSGQFWDGRAPSLVAQVREVLTSPTEMDASIPVLEKKLTDNLQYHRAFQKEFDSICSDDPVTMERIQEALAAYVGTLAPMNSAFDQYMAGNRRAMNTEQIKGFNLFMGKGLCGTCHFAPLFNGSTPPFFNRSEYEVLGIPRSDESIESTLDDDPGRYRLYPADIYRHAFKIPTVRNAARTAPYMHNGRFRTLHRVMDFYNKGGGRGQGINVPQQTLPDKPLHLTAAEINAIIAFMNSLTDDLHEYTKRK